MNDVADAFVGLADFWSEASDTQILLLAVFGLQGKGYLPRFLLRSVPVGPSIAWFVSRELSRLILAYDRLYAWISGTHPNRRVWHCQWLSVKDLYRDLRLLLPKLEGRLLDIGCMEKPYACWASGVREHVGVDVFPGKSVDYVIRDGEPWPLGTASFQSVLCTQALQVVKNPMHLAQEIDRVLVDDGVAVIATPFCYNDMSAPLETGLYRDYWRHTIHGVQEIFADRFDVVEVRRQGGIGSTTGVMVLNWIHMSVSRHSAIKALFVFLLPLWLLLCVAVNLAGWSLDKLDRTGAFYHNVLLVLRKKAAGGSTMGTGPSLAHRSAQT